MITTRLLVWTLVFISNVVIGRSKGKVVEGDTSVTVVPPAVSPSDHGHADGQSDPCTGNCLASSLTSRLTAKCPTLRQSFEVNFLPNGTGNNVAGISRKLMTVDIFEDCVSTCCDLDICIFAIFTNSSCQLFFCTNGIDACEPKRTTLAKGDPEVKLVWVHPPLKNFRENSSCETGAGTECLVNEDCYPKNTRARNGYCGCKRDPPFVYNDQGVCTQVPSVDTLESKLTAIPAVFNETPTPAPEPIQTLGVEVDPKNVTLPDNSVVLYAYANPESPGTTPYTYEWQLISHPEHDTAVTEGKAEPKLHLTSLIVGTYVFQVTVKSPKATAAANVTVNVFPAKRENKPPIVIISPPSQTIQLPVNSAVLDGTSSSDDDKIVSYKWDLEKGPIDYAFTKAPKNTSTLQINDLVPGNYTFKLTVEDVDGAKNSTTARVTVMKEIDYPPTANAGKDIVIYLPQTEVTLNGNASTDDKKIVQWEWKATGDVKKAVDMQDTHTPYLKLAGLEEGMYTFELTVTDESGQVSQPSTVHVFVKKPTGNPPKADAGPDQTIALPLTWVILDGSGSTTDTKILKWEWTQLTGPTNVTWSTQQEVRVNVSGLTKGDYVFELRVEDDAKLSAKDSVNITVAQKINEPPKANAGKDLTVTLPASLVTLDGSESKDDVEVTEWKWERQGDSLAAGVILGDSDTSSKLKLSNLVPGKYSFKLIVKDEQGLSDEDVVSLLVTEDPLKKTLIEVVLGVKLGHLQESEKERFLQKMALLVHDTRLVFHHLEAQFNSEFSIVYLYGVNIKNETIQPLSLASELREKLRRDVGLLDFPVESIDTLLCLQPCSGHGTCEDFSTGRECVCDPFWMESYIKRHYGNGDRNCDWSKIYVGVVTCFLLLMIMTFVWSLVYLYRRNRRQIRAPLGTKIESSFVNGSVRSSNRRSYPGRFSGVSTNQTKHYSLIEEDEDEIELESRGDQSEEDSDSEESLIFERGKDSGSKSVSMSLLKHTAGPAPSNGLPRNGIHGILKKPRPGGGSGGINT